MQKDFIILCLLVYEKAVTKLIYLVSVIKLILDRYLVGVILEHQTTDLETKYITEDPHNRPLFKKHISHQLIILNT